MKIVVGLGNPGLKYRRTRHNLGFMVVDALAEQREARWRRGRLKCLQAEAQLGKEQVLLVKPLTYMNLSGEAVGGVVRYYQCPLEDLLVVFDEVQLELGRLRLRPNGSAGGHNGMESVITHLGSEEFPRLRLGVGAPPEWMYMMSYVLGVFPRADLKTVQEMIGRAVLAVETWVYHGVSEAMNRFNAS
jgi:peptidyl-tRNA hydrolase, PTH1 family